MLDVLLLHGAKFSSQTWHSLISKANPDMNTLSMLAAAGCRVVAIDLPGTSTVTVVSGSLVIMLIAASRFHVSVIFIVLLCALPR